MGLHGQGCGLTRVQTQLAALRIRHQRRGAVLGQRLADGRRKVTGALVAIIRMLRHRSFQHHVPDLGQHQVQVARRHCFFAQHFVHDGRRVAGERFLARQKLVEDDAAGKQVASRVHALAQKLLRRHVRWCAKHGPGKRQLGSFGAGDAKVSNFHPAIGQHDQIGGLDIAVNHALAVRVRQRIQYFSHDACRLAHGEAFVGLKVILQLLAFNEFHRNKSHALARQPPTTGLNDAGVVIRRNGFTVVIHRHHARVIQPPGRLRFALKPRHDVGRFALDQLRWQDGLDRHPAQQHRVKSFVHHAHGAFAQLSANLVFTQLGD